MILSAECLACMKRRKEHQWNKQRRQRQRGQNRTHERGAVGKSTSLEDMVDDDMADLPDDTVSATSSRRSHCSSTSTPHRTSGRSGKNDNDADDWAIDCFETKLLPSGNARLLELSLVRPQTSRSLLSRSATAAHAASSTFQAAAEVHASAPATANRAATDSSREDESSDSKNRNSDGGCSESMVNRHRSDPLLELSEQTTQIAIKRNDKQQSLRPHPTSALPLRPPRPLRESKLYKAMRSLRLYAHESVRSNGGPTSSSAAGFHRSSVAFWSEFRRLTVVFISLSLETCGEINKDEQKRRQESME